ncbi:MAG TPA: cob(I)yrinic acid a,c-diamide adenosyltransferase [Prolixibacteraceae bacterium]|nr:cob(I)yrinic acid a,c-diamide adenosyltransferase [Prolixibacteraceae bacterium]
MNKDWKIYTKTGDDGTSGLIGGTRVEKDDPRLEAYGTLDEINAWMGVVRTGVHDEKIRETLDFIQNALFTIGSILASDKAGYGSVPEFSLRPDASEILESEIDRMQQTLPPLQQFILPGGTSAAAYAHVARTVCRRAERRIASLSKSITPDPNVLIFINRLSDYMFVLSRFLNDRDGHPDTLRNTAKG